jgi:uncharacterized protein
MLGALLLFGAQVAASYLWLSRYRFGPLEWLWRSLSYRRWHTIRLGRPERVALAAAEQ